MNDFYPLDRGEILKYLRCKKEDDRTLALIDSAENIIKENISPRFVFRVLDIKSIDQTAVSLVGTSLKLCGKNIVKHLEGTEKVILFAATLGETGDRLLRTAQVRDMAEALVLDCSLSVAIESFCNLKEAEFRKKAKESQKFITSRFSPGYGDFPILTQKEILAVLDAQRKIGLYVTEENLLLPSKSVTAVIGVSDHAVSGTLASCKNCVLKGKCEFIKSGTTCYN